ncbi:MAG: hypothetical protein AAGM22_22710 [Acidobacteriota bacterium]
MALELDHLDLAVVSAKHIARDRPVLVEWAGVEQIYRVTDYAKWEGLPYRAIEVCGISVSPVKEPGGTLEASISIGARIVMERERRILEDDEASVSAIGTELTRAFLATPTLRRPETGDIDLCRRFVGGGVRDVRSIETGDSRIQLAWTFLFDFRQKLGAINMETIAR